MGEKLGEPNLTPLTRIELKRIDLPDLVAVDPLLTASPLCLSLDRAGLQGLLRSGNTWRFSAGSPVFCQGEPGDSLFFVLRGDLRLTASNGGPSVTLGVASKGEIAGESDVLSNDGIRTSTAIAQAELDVAEFSRRTLIDLARTNIGLMLHLAEVREQRRNAGADLTDFMNRW